MRRIHLAILLIAIATQTYAGDARNGDGSPGRVTTADLTPEMAEESYRLGKQALSDKRYSVAIKHLTNASLARPDDIELHYWIGVACWNREQAEEAIAAYRRAIDSDPNSESDWSLYALGNLAEVQTRIGQMLESRATYLAAQERESRPEWRLKIANQIAELDLAMGEFVPDEHTVFNNDGDVIGGVGPEGMHTNREFELARHTNDPRKEEVHYTRAIAIDPDMYQPYFNLGLALTHQGRYTDAIPWFEKSDSVWKADHSSNPDAIDKTDAHAFLALCYLEEDDVGRAAVHIERALATGNPDFWASLYKQRVNVALGKAKSALPFLEALAADNPEHAETLHALYEAYKVQGQEDEAFVALEAAIQTIPDGHPWMLLLRERWKHLVPISGTP